ncbi:hypothetical protein [Ekhidna sp.]|uniref:hypothetical protein n=1 Tax=Ekhidna sp. TaxID=2608089 RepID=UPI003BAAF6A9
MELKETVYAECIKILEAKIANLKSEIDAVQESAISDTKSSMGDKYETGREVMMQERNRLGGQYDVYVKQLAALRNLDPTKSSEEVGRGSLVETDKGVFYISVPLGNIKIDEKPVFVISEGAPIAKAMMGMRVKESHTFNKQPYLIKSIK